LADGLIESLSPSSPLRSRLSARASESLNKAVACLERAEKQAAARRQQPRVSVAAPKVEPQRFAAKATPATSYYASGCYGTALMFGQILRINDTEVAYTRDCFRNYLYEAIPLQLGHGCEDGTFVAWTTLSVDDDSLYFKVSQLPKNGAAERLLNHVDIHGSRDVSISIGAHPVRTQIENWDGREVEAIYEAKPAHLAVLLNAAPACRGTSLKIDWMRN
jgi:hypothetical protein